MNSKTVMVCDAGNATVSEYSFCKASNCVATSIALFSIAYNRYTNPLGMLCCFIMTNNSDHK